MTTKVRKLTATVSAAALLGAGGVGAAQAASGTTDRPAGPRGGHHALSTTQLQTIASKLGVTTGAAADGDRRQQAVEAGGRRGEDMAATLAARARRGDGEGPDDPRRQPADPARHASARRAAPASPDNSKLVTALATGLSLDEATVKAAFDEARGRPQDRARDAQEDARYAAIATALGVDAADVEAAFEAVRPARPAK